MLLGREENRTVRAGAFPADLTGTCQNHLPSGWSSPDSGPAQERYLRARNLKDLRAQGPFIILMCFQVPQVRRRALLLRRWRPLPGGQGSILSEQGKSTGTPWKLGSWAPLGRVVLGGPTASLNVERYLQVSRHFSCVDAARPSLVAALADGGLAGLLYGVAAPTADGLALRRSRQQPAQVPSLAHGSLRSHTPRMGRPYVAATPAAPTAAAPAPRGCCACGGDHAGAAHGRQSRRRPVLPGDRGQ